MVSKINRRAMSHKYIDIETLDIPDKTNRYLVIDLVRILDSAPIWVVTNFLKNNQINIESRKKEKLMETVVFSLLNSIDISDINDYHNELIGKYDRMIIDYNKRDYNGILGTCFLHEHFEKAHFDIVNNYSKPKHKNIAFWTTCSSTKPYLISDTFNKIFAHLKDKVDNNLDNIHWLVVSNASAPIPEEYHRTFPFYAYECDLRSLNKKEIEIYKTTTIERLHKYLNKTEYDFHIAYMRPNSIQAVIMKTVMDELDISYIVLPTQATIKKIKSTKKLLWDFQGMKTKYSLDELVFTINNLN